MAPEKSGEARRTKIVCTIGPASESEEVLERLILAGMDVARLNFAHGTSEEHARVIRRIDFFYRSAPFGAPGRATVHVYGRR